MLLIFYRLICGYLYIRVDSKTPEKILNLCAAKGINIWGVTKTKKALYFKTGISSFKALRKYMRNVSGRLHITAKKGLPFLIERNQHRYGMPLGFACYILLLCYFSGFVWNIHINGNQSVTKKEILDGLNKIGITEGTPIKNIDPEEKRHELLLETDGISWAAINIEGSVLTVDVAETKKFEPKSTEPSNLKSDSDGIIKKIEVISGTPQVKVGDAVSTGDLLISGLTEYTDGSERTVRARGSVVAEITHNFTVIQPLKLNQRVQTKNNKNLSVLNFFHLHIPLYLGAITPDYDIEISKKSIPENANYYPVYITRARLVKTEQSDIVLTDEQAKRKACDKMRENIKNFLINGSEISRKDTYLRENDNMILKTELVCQKNITKEEKLLITTGN